MSVRAEGTGRKNREPLALNPRSPLHVKQKEDNFLKCYGIWWNVCGGFFFFLNTCFHLFTT